MMHLVATELLKARTTRLWWGLGLGLLGLTLAGGVLTLIFIPDIPNIPTADEIGQRQLIGAGGTSTVFALVFGIIGMAGEHRQGTITPTFLGTPVRWRVVVAKAAAYAIAGLLYGMAASIVAATVFYVGLGLQGSEVVLSGSDIFSILGGQSASAGFFGAIGVGFGALVPNQIGALIGALVEQLVVEPLLFGFFPEQGRFLIGGAASILSGQPSMGATLSLWVAAAVLVAWALALLAGGTLITQHKDIT